MSFILADVPRVLHVSHTLASSSEGTPIEVDENADASAVEAPKATHGVLHLLYANVHNGRSAEVPGQQRASLVLSRGQVESLTAQLYRMLDRVGGGGTAEATA